VSKMGGGRDDRGGQMSRGEMFRFSRSCRSKTSVDLLRSSVDESGVRVCVCDALSLLQVSKAVVFS